VGDSLRLRVGDVTVVGVVERAGLSPAGAFLPASSARALATQRGWLHPWALTDDNQMRYVIQALCLEADGRRIVVDTCVGQRAVPAPYDTWADDGGFLDALTDAGFGRDDVDLVICTHLHFDHVGWNTMLEDGRWVPTFRNARYLVTRTEYEHWRDVAVDMREALTVFNLDDVLTPLFDAGQVDLVDVDHRVSGSIDLVWTPGHSPGHVSVRIVSIGATALITGDCAHHPAQLTEPDWYTVADTDPKQSSETRRQLVDSYADTDVLIIGTHFPPPGAGHLVSADGRVRFRPVTL